MIVIIRTKVDIIASDRHRETMETSDVDGVECVRISWRVVRSVRNIQVEILAHSDDTDVAFAVDGSDACASYLDVGAATFLTTNSSETDVSLCNIYCTNVGLQRLVFTYSLVR
ncbi:hypothetical protein Trydic_g15167 [Trypoxylus dichotomus]